MDALEIKLRLDRSHADREAAAFHAAEKRRAAETAREQARAAREAAKQQQAAIKTTEKASQDAAREQARAAREAAREQAKAAREAAREKARIDNRELSETEIRERSKAAIYRKTNQQRIAELLKAHKTEIDKARESEQEAARVMGAAKSAVASFATQMVGLSGVSAVANEIVGGFQRVRDSIFKSTDLMQEFRETLLELAALKGRLGDTTAESFDVLRMQSQTSQRTQDVVDLQTGFLGMAELMVGEGKGKKISAADAQKAMIGLGRLQAAQGAPAEAFGELGGIILQSAKGPMTPEAVTKEAAALYDLQQPGNFGKGGFGSAIKQFGKALPFIDAGVLTDKEAMALTSAFSISAGGEESGTALRQFLQGTVGSLSGDRTIKGLEGEEKNIGAATYLRDLGAKAGMHPVKIAKLVAADLDRAEAEAKAKGEGFDSIDYLKRHGYANQESALRMMQFRGLGQTGAWGGFEKLISDPTLGEGRQAEAEAKLASDMGLVGRSARAADAMQAMLAATPQEEWMRSMRQFGYARLGGARAGMNKFEDIEKSWAISPSNLIWGEKSRVEQSTQEMIMSAARRMGVDFKYDVSPVGNTGEVRRSMSEDEQYRVSRELALRGYNFGKETLGGLVDAAENLNQAAGMLRSAAAPPALQGAPQQPPAAAR